MILSLSLLGQSEEYTALLIPKDLKTKANSIVRLDDYTVDIPNISTINIHHKRAVTILNKKGNRDADTYIYYDEVSRVKSINVTIYNALGLEIAKFKKRDFTDVSATDGFSLHTDTRILYIDYTPTSYPYTIVMESDKTSSNTAHIPSLYMNTGYYSSTQKINYKLTYDTALGFRYKHIGNEKRAIIVDTKGILTVTAENIPAIVADWQSFGKWMDDYLLEDTKELPPSTVKMVQQLVEGIEDPIDRARKIYEYMQDKTRYVSIQIGIGGWKPMTATRVDEVGYGDCKALSMYTKSLLDVADVPSYYTIVYGDSDKRDIQKDFAGVQGNHAILTLPREDNSYVWLECTSQQAPFGFIAGFTDDRDVLIVTPEGGKIVHTQAYTPEDNYQKIDGAYTLAEDGSIDAKVSIVSGGTQYGDRMTLDLKEEEKQKEHYYKFWDYLSNPKLTSILLNNDKNEIVLSEKVDFTVNRYATFAGDEMIIPINVFNRFTSTPSRIKERTQDVKVSRGFSDIDKVVVKFPETYKTNVLPEPIDHKTPYGHYKQSIEKVSETELLYTRELVLNEGVYEKEAYKDFRNFFKKISRSDQSKMILIKR